MKRVWLLAIVLVCPVLAVAGASADAGDGGEPAAEEKNGWSPALDMSLNVFNFDGDGRVISGVGQSNFGTGHLTLAEFKLGLDLSSPEVDLGFVEPRFVAFGGAQVGPSAEVVMAQLGEFIINQPSADIARAISAANPTPPPNPPPPPVAYPPTSSYSGQGSLVEATYEGFGWYLGAGLEFDTPGLEDLLRFRTYVIYLGEQMAARGQLVSVRDIENPVGVPTFFIHNQMTSAKEDFHYLGPGLEADLILTQSPRLGVVFYVAGDFLFNVGDGRIEMRGGTTLEEVPDPRALPVTDTSEVITYFYDTPSFRYNLQFGLRLAWRNMF